MRTVRQPREETKMTALIDRQLVDKAIEAYVAWREACVWLNDTYLAWSRRRGSVADATFGEYTAALDHEERTVTCYASVLERVSDVLGATTRIANRVGPA